MHLPTIAMFYRPWTVHKMVLEWPKQFSTQTWCKYTYIFGTNQWSKKNPNKLDKGKSYWFLWSVKTGQKLAYNAVLIQNIPANDHETWWSTTVHGVNLFTKKASTHKCSHLSKSLLLQKKQNKQTPAVLNMSDSCSIRLFIIRSISASLRILHKTVINFPNPGLLNLSSWHHLLH